MHFDINEFQKILETEIKNDIAKHGSVENFRDSIAVDGPTFEEMFGKEQTAMFSKK